MPEQIASLAAGKKTPLEIVSVLRFEDATNYSSLDHVNIPREHIQRNPLQAIKFARDTLALVEKIEPRPEFKKTLDGFERQVLELLETCGAKVARKTKVKDTAKVRAPAKGGETIGGRPWKSKTSPHYRRMLELVSNSVEPLVTQDIAGTCNQNPCRCGTCWVRKAHQDFLERRRQN